MRVDKNIESRLLAEAKIITLSNSANLLILPVPRLLHGDVMNFIIKERGKRVYFEAFYTVPWLSVISRNIRTLLCRLSLNGILR